MNLNYTAGLKHRASIMLKITAELLNSLSHLIKINLSDTTKWTLSVKEDYVMIRFDHTFYIAYCHRLEQWATKKALTEECSETRCWINYLQGMGASPSGRGLFPNLRIVLISFPTRVLMTQGVGTINHCPSLSRTFITKRQTRRLNLYKNFTRGHHSSHEELWRHPFLIS